MRVDYPALERRVTSSAEGVGRSIGEALRERDTRAVWWRETLRAKLGPALLAELALGSNEWILVWFPSGAERGRRRGEHGAYLFQRHQGGRARRFLGRVRDREDQVLAATAARGVYLPHLAFESARQTGRTSSREPNLQNVPRPRR